MNKLGTWEPPHVLIIQSTRDSANELTVSDKAQLLIDSFGSQFNLADSFRLSLIAESNNTTIKDLEFLDATIKKYHLNDGIKEVESVPKHSSPHK